MQKSCVMQARRVACSMPMKHAFACTRLKAAFAATFSGNDSACISLDVHVRMRMWMCMWMCMWACACACAFAFACACAFACGHAHAHLHVHVQCAFACACACACAHVHVHVRICVCMCMCMCTCACVFAFSTIPRPSGAHGVHAPSHAGACIGRYMDRFRILQSYKNTYPPAGGPLPVCAGTALRCTAPGPLVFTISAGQCTHGPVRPRAVLGPVPLYGYGASSTSRPRTCTAPYP